MKTINSVVLLLIGTAFGIGMVLSCSDNSPNHSDAATCDCPASEAPITGRVVVIEATPQVIQPDQQGGAGIACSPGMQFLTGSCYTNLGSPRNTTLMEFGFDKQSLAWTCQFRNNETVPVTVNASVLCLKPAP